jgi:hypothetical protein
MGRMTRERAEHLWGVWVGQQTPLEFAHEIERSGMTEGTVEAYCRAMDAQEPKDARSTDDQIAEAVKALVMLSQQALEAEQQQDRTDPRD